MKPTTPADLVDAESTIGSHKIRVALPVRLRQDAHSPIGASAMYWRVVVLVSEFK